ncbi:bifunctional diaminohydroxyphosphoribosylaminopyrimidine deaminase/5-amino-6-(5-phosphoribosylamino)uracil reductase RibD [Jiulongibacter sp. NS-SX5]|uniref:bifunctional diaminohydroxyphosphoribosylaminopyrimidine deaminase/5-amino-6-(5-phosphoribosylamino)uracil reductase RibD n=1 Tax=Jiulongibacter sp. NS-SX5 TaxID=3463854 RepID=UPI004058B1F4
MNKMYMQRALELAQLGSGEVSPNPMVGCVIVHNDKIIGEGWHQKYGGPHAEVNAINSVSDKTLLPESTVYVTLEPCSHFGKTPPCADLLIKHNVRKVVICNRDPFPEVNGKGIQKLKDAGIKVKLDFLTDEGEILNKRFFHSVRKKRPYVILKWAETADGFIAGINGQPVKISGPLSQMHSHKWRAEEDAILVGANTILNDSPRLNTRHWSGKNPTRVIFDPNGKIKEKIKLGDFSSPTIVFTSEEFSSGENLTVFKIKESADPVDLILKELNKLNIRSVIVEGGARLHTLFFKSQKFEEVRVFKSKHLKLTEGLTAAQVPPGVTLTNQIDCIDDRLQIFSA